MNHSENRRAIASKALSACALVLLFVPFSCSQVGGQTSSSSALPSDAFGRGMAFLKGGDLGRAQDEFRRLEVEGPQSPEGWTGEGIVLGLSHETSKAMTALDHALAIDPNYLMARRELGILAWGSGDKERAARELTTVITAVPDDRAVEVILGEYSFETARYADAVKYFGDAESRIETSPRLLLEFASALVHVKRESFAVDVLGRLEGIPSLTAEERFRSAWLFGEAEDYQRAIAAFRALPEDFDKPSERDYGLALAYYQTGKWDESIEALSRFDQKSEVEAGVLDLRGAAEAARGRLQEADLAFRQEMVRFPKVENGYLNAAVLAIKQSDFDTAEKVLGFGIEHIPNSHRLHLTLGATFTLRGDLGNAEANYRTAVSLAPNDVEAQAALGVCYMDEHKEEDAKRVFRDAIGRGIEDVRLYYYLTDVLFEQGIGGTTELNEAMQIVNASIHFEPKFAYSYLQRGRLELMTSHVNEAIADFEHARGLEPDSTDTAVTYQLALAYRDAGRRSEANRLLAGVSDAIKKQDAAFRHGAMEGIVGTPVSDPFKDR